MFEPIHLLFIFIAIQIGVLAVTGFVGLLYMLFYFIFKWRKDDDKDT